MTGYVVDTSVLSATAPDKRPLPPKLAGWLADNEDRLYISIVTVAEVEQGIALLRRAGGAERAGRISDWLERMIDLFGRRLLLLTPSVARTFGQMAADALSIGRHPGFPDVAIAATARAHGLTVLTRNVKHFEPLDVPLLDPFAVP